MDDAAVARARRAARRPLRQDPRRSPRRSRTALATPMRSIVRNRTQVDRGAARRRHRRSRSSAGSASVSTTSTSTRCREHAASRSFPATGRQCARRGRVRDRLRDAAAARRVCVDRGRWRTASGRVATLSNGRELAGKTLGVVGFGGIGRLAGALARRARHARDRLRRADRQRRREVWSDEATTPRRSLTHCWPRPTSCPCTCRSPPQTRHLIDARALGQMKPRRDPDQHRARRRRRRSGASLRRCGGQAGRRGARRVRAGAARRRFAARRLSRISLLTPHIAGVTARIERARVDADRGQGGCGVALASTRLTRP